MQKLTCFLCIIFFLLSARSQAQTIFVDVQKGSDSGQGTSQSPFSSLEKAMESARKCKPAENVTIKVLPGLYILKDKIVFDKATVENAWLSIEAAIMPDDTNWSPAKMPVIQSVSPVNTTTQFPHAVGFLAATNRVSIKGLKFLGNANPETKYYYPVAREDSTLTGLAISQCYFIGEKNSAPIQGSIFTHGASIHVEHCVFYGVKNALLLFKAIKDFSITNSIIVGAYEAAVWYGPFNAGFVFKNNIVSNCTYLWLRQENTYPKYIFSNSLFLDMPHLMGYYGKNGSVPAEKNEHVEQHIQKSGKLILSEVETNGLPDDYLNPTAKSAGKELNAGIFKKAR